MMTDILWRAELNVYELEMILRNGVAYLKGCCLITEYSWFSGWYIACSTGGRRTVGCTLSKSWVSSSEFNGSSIVHLLFSCKINSRGSPCNTPSILVREWQPAAARTISRLASSSERLVGSMFSNSLVKTGSPFSFFLIAFKQLKSNPSSVRVPVLSKQDTLMDPQTLIAESDMQ